VGPVFGKSKEFRSEAAAVLKERLKTADVRASRM